VTCCSIFYLHLEPLRSSLRTSLVQTSSFCEDPYCLSVKRSQLGQPPVFSLFVNYGSRNLASMRRGSYDLNEDMVLSIQGVQKGWQLLQGAAG
jgi:hypothetical protein